MENVKGAGVSAVRRAIFKIRERFTTTVQLQWLRLLDTLSKDQLAFLPLAEFKKRAMTGKFKFIRKEKELEKMLQAFTGLGLVLQLKGSVTQSQMVVLDPNWLSQNLSKLVSKGAIRFNAAEKAGLADDWKTFRKRGVASVDLLELLWGKGTEKTEFFIDVARQSLLLHDLSSSSSARVSASLRPISANSPGSSLRRKSHSAAQVQTDFLVSSKLRIRRKGELRSANPTSLAQICLLKGPLAIGSFHRMVCMASSYGASKAGKEGVKPALIGVDFAVIPSPKKGGRVWVELSKSRSEILVASSQEEYSAKDLKIIVQMLKNVNQEVLESNQQWRLRYLDQEKDAFVEEAEAKKRALQPWFASARRNSDRASTLAKLDLDAFFEAIQR